MSASDRPHADLLLEFRDDGLVDLALAGSELATTDSHENLVQALKMRLLSAAASSAASPTLATARASTSSSVNP